MTGKRSGMTGFLDLALIMVGATALVAQVNIEKAQSVGAPQAEQTSAKHTEHYSFSIADLFNSGEARLSDNGQRDIAALAAKLRKGNIRVNVPAYIMQDSNRLSGWELASARTAALFHALNSQGIAPNRLEAAPVKLASIPHARENGDKNAVKAVVISHIFQKTNINLP